MYIKLLKPQLIARHNHQADEVVDVEKNRAKALIRDKAAVKAEPPPQALPGDGDDEPAEEEDDEEPSPIKQEAVLPPRGRRATRNP